MALVAASVEQTIKCCVPEEKLSENRDFALTLGIEYLTGMGGYRVPLAVVGGGDSASEVLGWDGDIMAINGAYDWLRGHGVTPRWFLGTDPQPEMLQFVGDISSRTGVLLADFSDPGVLLALRDHPELYLLRLMHPGYERDRRIEIPGGPSAMTRAPVVAAYLGYRKLRLFGADCCVTDRQHVYDDAGDYQERRGSVIIGGRKFSTTPQYFAQARYLSEMVPALADDMSITIAGNNLATTMLDWAAAQKVKLHRKLKAQEHGDIRGV